MSFKVVTRGNSIHLMKIEERVDQNVVVKTTKRSIVIRKCRIVNDFFKRKVVARDDRILLVLEQ